MKARECWGGGGGGGSSLLIHFKFFLIIAFYLAFKSFFFFFLSNGLLFIILYSINFANINLILILSNILINKYFIIEKRNKLRERLNSSCLCA